VSSKKRQNPEIVDNSRVDIPAVDISLEEDDSLDLNFSSEEQSPLEQPPPSEHLELEAQVNDIKNQAGEDPLTSNQIDILKRYIEIKEAEARDLRIQQEQYQDFSKKAGVKIDSLVKKNRKLTAELEEARRSVALLQSESDKERAHHTEQVIILKSDYDEKLRQAGATQDQFRELLRKREEFKEKVKEDLKRIKLKERELENKYELLRTDTQTLLDAKDKQILELKKKTDALDLELESLDEKLRETASVVNQVSVKKRRLIETLKLTISLLEDIDKETVERDPLQERKAG
jgi:chromosome segregation ATPase